MLLPAIALLLAAIPPPQDWVPARWPSSDPATLELVRNSPINCLILDQSDWSPGFIKAAANAGLATLARVEPGPQVNKRSQAAIEAGLTGLLLEGDFDANSKPSDLPPGFPIVELTQRSRMPLDATSATARIIGSYQGLWPGIHPEDKGTTHASASGGVWIDTNSGFLRFVRSALPNVTVWIGNTPPSGSIYPTERYLQAIADAAMTGARWVLAFDADFSKRLMAREEKAVKQWGRITAVLAFYESHQDWRKLPAFAKLALVESPASGALLSGGVLDMIATQHTPVRPIPTNQVDRKRFDGAKMAVNIDPDALSPDQKEALKAFTRSGGTLLSGPPGWRFPELRSDQITLGKDDTEKLDQIWKELNSMTGRQNLGARLFNVSTVLSSLSGSADGKLVVLHLVNYTDFPAESITVHLLGEYKKALLYRPDSAVPVTLELYKTDEGSGLDVDQLSSVAAIVLQQ